jgi:hypothetical protein
VLVYVWKCTNGGFREDGFQVRHKAGRKIAIFIMRWGETFYDLPFPLNYIVMAGANESGRTHNMPYVRAFLVSMKLNA